MGIGYSAWLAFAHTNPEFFECALDSGPNVVEERDGADAVCATYVFGEGMNDAVARGRARACPMMDC